MKVDGKANRVIDENGNQVLTVSVNVVSETQQPVLPLAESYSLGHVSVVIKDGAVSFEVPIIAANPKSESDVPKLPSQLSRFEQDELYRKSLEKPVPELPAPAVEESKDGEASV